MGYGLLQMGEAMKGDAMTGLRQTAEADRQRNALNQQIKKQNQMSKVSGTASGAMTGFMIGGPYGAAIGALAGWALS